VASAAATTKKPRSVSAVRADTRIRERPTFNLKEVAATGEENH